MFWYATMYALGVAAAMLSPLPQLERVLNLIDPISITALVASLLVPFAGFSTRERVQKWAVQYGIVPIFGAYSVVVWHEGSAVGLLMLAGSTAVHLGYWMSSIHSRQYRFNLFRAAFAAQMPGTMQLIARLNATGQSHAADNVVALILDSSELYDGQVEETVNEFKKHNGIDQKLATIVVQELRSTARQPA